MQSILPALLETPALGLAALTQTLGALVRINSVNPAYGGPPRGEADVVAWLENFLTGQGAACRRILSVAGRPCLRVRLEGVQPGPALLFQTHVDTVSIQGMTIDPLAGRVEGGRLLGRGATDAKAQVAAMDHALLAWLQLGRRPPRTIELALCCDEEHGFGGAEAVLQMSE